MGLRVVVGVVACALLGVFTLGGCAAVPPQTRATGPIQQGLPERLYVQAAREREAVVASLERGGFTVARELRDVAFMLNVRIGRSRSAKECGSLKNVVYELRYSGMTVATITGRGWTGSCSPNILDQSTVELLRLFGVRPPSADPGARPL